MSRQLRYLPGGQFREDTAGQRITLLLERVDLFADVDVSIFGCKLQLTDFGFQLGNRLFEVEKIRVHLFSGRPSEIRHILAGISLVTMDK